MARSQSAQWGLGSWLCPEGPGPSCAAAGTDPLAGEGGRAASFSSPGSSPSLYRGPGCVTLYVVACHHMEVACARGR